MSYFSDRPPSFGSRGLLGRKRLRFKRVISIWRDDLLTVAYYKECWDITKGDLLKVFEEFFERKSKHRNCQ